MNLDDKLREEIRGTLITLQADTISDFKGLGGIGLRTFGFYTDPLEYAVDRIIQSFADAEKPDTSSALKLRGIDYMTGQEWEKWAIEHGWTKP